MNTIIFFDTETTGLKKEDKLFQIAYSYVGIFNTNYGNFTINNQRKTVSKMVNPKIAITPEASMTTGISNSEVINKPYFEETLEYKEINNLSKKKDTYFLAYNSPFDVEMLKKDNIFLNEKNVIDLYRIAKHVFKKETILNRNNEEVPLTNNKLQYFRFLYDFDNNIDFIKLKKEYGLEKVDGHEALSDVLVLEHFYNVLKTKIQKYYKDKWFEKMLSLSKSPVLEPFITFGNVFEKGTSFNTCFTSTYEQYGRIKNGYDYLDWCVNNLSLSVDTLYSLKMHFFYHIIQGRIPFNKGFNKFVEYGIAFEQDKNKIKKGIEILNSNKNENQIRTKVIEELKKEYEQKKNEELGDWFPSFFQIRFLKNK